MLLTLSTTHQPAEDFGYLLRKHPQRVHEFALPYGPAHVFYPEANEDAIPQIRSARPSCRLVEGRGRVPLPSPNRARARGEGCGIPPLIPPLRSVPHVSGSACKGS